MAELPTSSFIPKRNPGKKVHQVRRYNFFIIPVICYAIFIAAPVASAAVFIYQIYTDKIFNQEVINLDTAIKTFSEADMARVVEFNQRLKASTDLLNSHVSLLPVLSVLESSAIQAVLFENLNIERIDKNTLTVTADLVTDTFDSAIFQRANFVKQPIFATSDFGDINFSPEVVTEVGLTEQAVQFTGTFAFSADSILYTPNLLNAAGIDLDIADIGTDIEASVSSDISDTGEDTSESASFNNSTI